MNTKKEIESIYKSSKMYIDDGQVVIEGLTVNNKRIVALFNMCDVRELVRETFSEGDLNA